MIYRHIQTNKKYIRLLNCKVKFIGIWIDAIIYMSLNFKLYVRTKSDFHDKFKRI